MKNKIKMKKEVKKKPSLLSSTLTLWKWIEKEIVITAGDLDIL